FFSPDGNSILYYTSSNAITVMNTDGSNPVVVGTGAIGEWSPDGARIAFQTENGPGPIHVVNRDGTGEFAVPNATGDSASWSPDGTRILFRAGGQLYSIAPDGTGL